MSTTPSAPTCRSCEHYQSSASRYPVGTCAVWDTEVILNDGCSQHEPAYLPENDTVLVERQCLACGHVNVYALGFGGFEFCAQCAGGTNA